MCTAAEIRAIFNRFNFSSICHKIPHVFGRLWNAIRPRALFVSKRISIAKSKRFQISIGSHGFLRVYVFDEIYLPKSLQNNPKISAVHFHLTE